MQAWQPNQIRMRLKNRLVLCYSGFGTWIERPITIVRCDVQHRTHLLLHQFPREIKGYSNILYVWSIFGQGINICFRYHFIELKCEISRNHFLISENFIPSLIPTMWCFLSWIAALLFIRSYHRVNKTARNSLLSSLVTRSNDQTDTQNTTEHLRACFYVFVNMSISNIT